jgi:hypothetical protein
MWLDRQHGLLYVFIFFSILMLIFYLYMIHFIWVLKSYTLGQDKKTVPMQSIHKGYYSVWSQVFIPYCVVWTTKYWCTLYIFSEYCSNFDILFRRDSDYVVIIIIPFRSREEYTNTIHLSDFKAVMLQFRLKTLSLRL